VTYSVYFTTLSR